MKWSLYKVVGLRTQPILGKYVSGVVSGVQSWLLIDLIDDGLVASVGVRIPDHVN